MAPGASRNSEFDVVVAGGGPAGAATAIMCALAGLKTCILERRLFPRDRPGEALHPGVESVFRQLGVVDAIESADFPRHHGITIERASTTAFEPFSPFDGEQWLGFQALRAKLDAILLARARSLGCEVFQPCAAVNITPNDENSWTVHTSAQIINSIFAVDAGGGSHWMARRLALPLTRLTPTLVAHYAYRPNANDTPDQPVFQENDSGWQWRAKATGRLESWTALALTPGQAPVLPEGFDPRTHKRSDVTWRFVSNCAGPGYFLAGDAAAVIDPAASHGVLRALMSGILAASLIAKLRRREIRPEAACGYYRQWVLRWYLNDANELASRYAKLTAAPAWLSGVRQTCEVLAAGLRNEISSSF